MWLALCPVFCKNLGIKLLLSCHYTKVLTGVKFDIQPIISPLGVWMGDTEEWSSVYGTTNPDGVPVYFIEFAKYFDRDGIYHDAEFNDYLDNIAALPSFPRAGLQFCKDIGFQSGYHPRS